jgi:outer membrane protein assembly factor BamB
MKTALVLAITLSVVLSTEAQEWTRFRGPNGTGISDSKTIPVQWTERDYNWKITLPGGGHSSPVLWGDQIFLNCADGDKSEFVNVCLSATTGRTLWERRYPLGVYHTHKFNSLASGSCAVDEDRVYFLRQDGDHCFLVALTHDGEPAWEFALGDFKSQHGSGFSPIVYGNLVVLSYDQGQPGRVVALDRKTGELKWEIPRSAGMADYSVPCVFEQRGQPPRLLFNTSEDGINAVDPANGSITWRTDQVLRVRSVSSPVFVDGMTFASCGSGGGGNYVVAIDPPANGHGDARVIYEVKKSAPYVPAPLAYGDLVFLWSDGGIVTCIVAKTGEEKWRERVGGNFFSSPVCIDGKLYNTSADGKVVVLRASEQFEPLGKSDFDELTHATPAVANGRIFYRTFEHLISIGGPGKD